MAALYLLALFFVSNPGAQGVEWHVTIPTDALPGSPCTTPSDCSLRGAVLACQSNDTIVLDRDVALVAPLVLDWKNRGGGDLTITKGESLGIISTTHPGTHSALEVNYWIAGGVVTLRQISFQRFGGVVVVCVSGGDECGFSHLPGPSLTSGASGQGGERSGTVLDRVSFTECTPSYALLLAGVPPAQQPSTLIIRDCEFRDNEVRTSGQHLIYSTLILSANDMDAVGLVMKRNMVTNLSKTNRTTQAGIILSPFGSKATISGSELTDNKLVGLNTLLISAHGLTIRDSTITGNSMGLPGMENRSNASPTISAGLVATTDSNFSLSNSHIDLKLADAELVYSVVLSGQSLMDGSSLGRNGQAFTLHSFMQNGTQPIWNRNPMTPLPNLAANALFADCKMAQAPAAPLPCPAGQPCQNVMQEGNVVGYSC